ncbi:MAG: ATP-binding protein [bacterium]|nr:ATP-binding protein [bacterium]
MRRARIPALQVFCVGVALSMLMITGGNCRPSSSDRFESLENRVVDLSRLPACARHGFDSAWLRRSGQPRELSDGEAGEGDCPSGWHRVPGQIHGSRPLGVRDLGLPPERRIDRQIRGDREAAAFREYSLRILFPAPPPGDRGIVVPEDFALALGSIGLNWEIYVNGALLEREIHRDAAGDVGLKLYLRDHRVRIPGEAMHSSADNELFIRLIGDPGFALSGVAIGRPQAIGPAAAIENPLRDQIELALIVLYLAAGAFHILFFALRPAERASLYFGIFALVLFVYFFSRGPTVYAITRDMEILLRLELLCLYWTVPLFHIFIDTMLYGRPGRLTRVNVIFHLGLSVSAVALPIGRAWNALQIWQILAIPFLIYFLYELLQGARYEYIKQKVQKSGPGALHLLRHTLGRTMPGNLLLGYLILGAAAGYDVVDAVFLHRADELTRYGFFVFIMGIAGMLANRYVAAVHQVESLNEELRFRVVELNQANRGLRDSEERYRTLVEESRDIIFTLDENFRFVRANRSMHRILGVSQEQLAGSNFLELVYVDPDEERDKEALNSRQVLKVKLDEFATTRKPIFQKVLFRSSFLAEPKELHLRLEHVDVHGGQPEILGRASSVLEDNLLRFFIAERQSYRVGNSLITAEELSQRLVRNIGKYLDNQPLTGVRFGLREMLVNAIEHGNLSISYDDKTREIMSGNYKDFIKARQSNTSYRQRSVTVHYSLSPKRVLFLIRDEGDGFDHAAMRARKLEDLDAELSSHGRGIKMTESAFDRVRYNAKGNQVLLIKYFGRD